MNRVERHLALLLDVIRFGRNWEMVGYQWISDIIHGLSITQLEALEVGGAGRRFR